MPGGGASGPTSVAARPSWICASGAWGGGPAEDGDLGIIGLGVVMEQMEQKSPHREHVKGAEGVLRDTTAQWKETEQE